MSDLVWLVATGLAMFIGFGVHIVLDLSGIRKALEAIRAELEKRNASDAEKGRTL